MGQVEVKGTRAQAVGQFQFSFLLLMRFCKPLQANRLIQHQLGNAHRSRTPRTAERREGPYGKSQKSCDSKVGLEIGTYPRAHTMVFPRIQRKLPSDNPLLSSFDCAALSGRPTDPDQSIRQRIYWRALRIIQRLIDYFGRVHDA